MHVPNTETTTMTQDSSRYEIRLPTDLKRAFLEATKRNDRDGAQLLRDFIRHYVSQNAQADLLRAPPAKAKK